MDFVNIELFQPDVAELLSRFVLFPNQDRLVRYLHLHFSFSCMYDRICFTEQVYN